MPHYQKAGPKQVLVLSNGSGLKFQAVNDDIGIFATEDPGLIKEIESCIAGHRGGVERISPEQFLELLSKKNESSKPRWREEFKMQHVIGIPASSPTKSSAAVHVASKPEIKPAAPGDEFRPTATPR